MERAHVLTSNITVHEVLSRLVRLKWNNTNMNCNCTLCTNEWYVCMYYIATTHQDWVRISPAMAEVLTRVFCPFLPPRCKFFQVGHCWMHVLETRQTNAMQIRCKSWNQSVSVFWFPLLCFSEVHQYVKDSSENFTRTCSFCSNHQVQKLLVYLSLAGLFMYSLNVLRTAEHISVGNSS